MSRTDLLEEIRSLRVQGFTPAQIAREVGLSKAEVAPLLRQVAGRTAATPSDGSRSEPADRELLGCWVSAGWSTGLELSNAPELAAADPLPVDESTGTGGLVAVLVARAGDRPMLLTVCGYLVDVYCLGVKTTVGPWSVRRSDLDERSRAFFAGYPAGAVPAPLVLAQHLVHGAVAYAAGLGFEPDPDFATTAAHLGPAPEGPCPITFGRDGKPFYVSGPYDDARSVVNTLEAGVGPGNYHYLVTVD
jgi:hypothetical protein